MTISPEGRARFEQIGLPICRGDVGSGFLFQNDDALHGQMVEWVIEQDKLEAIKLSKERRSTLVWTKVGAVSAFLAAAASIVAAYPVLFGK